MAVWIFVALFAVITVFAIALSRHSGNVTEVLKAIRKTAVYVLYFAAACLFGVFVLLSTFSFTCSFFSSLLSSESIAGIRAILKVIFGSESVFTSLQMLAALSIFLFSFASCAFFICGVCVLLLRIRVKEEGRAEITYKQGESLPDCVSVKRFALLSRYLI